MIYDVAFAFAFAFASAFAFALLGLYDTGYCMVLIRRTIDGKSLHVAFSLHGSSNAQWLQRQRVPCIISSTQYVLEDTTNDKL